MRTLYESLFDDEDIITKNIDEYILKKQKQNLYYLKELLGKYRISMLSRPQVNNMLKYINNMPELFKKVDIKWDIKKMERPGMLKISPKSKLTNFHIIFIMKGKKKYDSIYIYDPSSKYDCIQEIVQYAQYGRLEYPDSFSTPDFDNMICYRISPVLNDWFEDIIKKLN